MTNQNPNKRSFTLRKTGFAKNAVIRIIAAVAFCLAVAILFAFEDTKASNESLVNIFQRGLLNPVVEPTPEGGLGTDMPPQTEATRIKVELGEKYDLQIATGVDSFVVVTPEVASVEARSRYNLNISAIKIGETILLVTYGRRRHTYVVEVVRRPSVTPKRDSSGGKNTGAEPESSGSLSVLYAQGTGGSPGVIRQNLDYRRKLANNRTVRVSGEMFKLIGNQNIGLAVVRGQDFALNRLGVGFDTPTTSIDLLESQVNISPLSLNNFTVRGVHVVSRPTVASGGNLERKGVDVYAGFARPAYGFFDQNGGTIVGAMIPVLNSDNFQARTGLTTISPDRNSRHTRGGTILQADAAFAPSKEISADAEVAFSNGDVSWRGRVDLKYEKYGAYAEATHFSRSSPFNSINAQPGGRDSEFLSFYWRPDRRLRTSIGYNHTQIKRLTNSRLADFDRSLIFANANYAITRNSSLNLRYIDQNIETAFAGSLSNFAIQTRTILIGNNHKFNKTWSNTIEGRVIFSSERAADEGLEKGFSLKEQLRYSRRGASVTGYLGYTHKTPSLTSLIVRNPQLLPPVLQAAFALDPAEFLRTNRDRLQFLLSGVELPQTRSFEAGVRTQKTFSRFTVMGDARYNAGEIYAVDQKRIYTSASVGIRLDNANALNITGWSSFGDKSHSGLTVSFTHRFGTSGDGFRLSRLLNFNRRKVRGRVFYDLNANGRFDAGEPGIARLKIQIDDKRTISTDKDGRYEFSANDGVHTVVLMSGDLGTRLLATSPTERKINLDGTENLDVNFGVIDFGTISGRIFNDTMSPSTASPGALGLSGVKVVLRLLDNSTGSFTLEQVTNSNGLYEFRNLRPGRYLVEIDGMTIPANFQIPAITASTIVVQPLQASYLDIPITAQRAISGVVFVDVNGDGTYLAGTDQPVEGVQIIVGGISGLSDVNGAYILRNLPAGRTTLRIRHPNGAEMPTREIELGINPVTERSVDLAINSLLSVNVPR